MVVSVVPITRLRRATDWWSYKVPTGVECPVGSLVVVPFRGHDMLGIVWNENEDDTQATESIKQVICRSLVHAPQRQLIEWLAETGITSLSTGLYVWMPSAIRSLPLTGPVRALLTSHTQWSAPTNPEPQQVILIPGDRPEIHGYIAKDPHWYTLDKQGDTTELESWLAVARGETLTVAGRERALWAPFLNLRQVTVIAPEDISYYHEQTPYLSLVDAAQTSAKASNAHFKVRSHLPGPVCEALWGTVPALHTETRVIELIDTPGAEILHPALIESVKKCIQTSKGALLLMNAYDHIINQADGTVIKLPGVETVRKNLAKALGLAVLPGNIHLDTRAMLTRRHTSIGFTAVIALDPLLRQAVFADTLHGLADIWTLLSYNVPCMIHVRDRSHPMVHSIRNNRLADYTLDFVQDQQTAALPPFCEHVVCSTSKTGVVSEVYEKLLPLTISPWQLGHPTTITRRKTNRESLSLFAPLGTRIPAPLRKVLAALPNPWKVERNPWFTI